MTPARDRILLWHTPFSVEYCANALTTLSVDAFTRLRAVQVHAVEPNTRTSYGAGLLRFTQYCDAHRISESDRMPASDLLLAAFVAGAAGKVASAQQWISGIKLWHKLNGAPWLGDGALQLAMKGVKKLAPESSRKPPRPPVTIEHMRALLAGLDLYNTRDAAVWAVASIAFWSICRLGEMIPTSAVSFTPRKHVTRGAELTRATTRNGVRCAALHIPFTKVTGEEGADIAITDLDDAMSPFYAMEYHLRVNQRVPADAPFFAFEQDDDWRVLTKDIFLARCKQVWQEAGIEVVSDGHSFRIGGTTEWLLRGTPPEIVAKQGRWRSNAFLLYWRKVQAVLPFFMSQAFNAFEAARLDQNMAEYEQTSRTT
ncbi:DNA breaking-rejoining enzyme [Auriscalpium vulgare]|uniref:DNA breaking-rejoining enzyme n=1 Tax=Auriscalpium vulgare TaxID=40419 RepID=A0ACB8R2Q5_9AGAM|nr:DNA breaking-rejoining enzyme [Auriscalpium vulgare]